MYQKIPRLSLFWLFYFFLATLEGRAEVHRLGNLVRSTILSNDIVYIDQSGILGSTGFFDAEELKSRAETYLVLGWRNQGKRQAIGLICKGVSLSKDRGEVESLLTTTAMRRLQGQPLRDENVRACYGRESAID